MTKNDVNSLPIPTVVFVQRRLPHYRLPFFEALRQELEIRGCKFRLLHGTPNQHELSKNDSGELPWAEKIATHYFLSGRVCWQPFAGKIKDADLVICSHENKLIFNLIVQYYCPSIRIALFGHGANLQGNPNSWSEKIKRIFAKRADWWFGYTAMSLPLINRFSFPANRITIANNSIDTEQMSEIFEKISANEKNLIRSRLGIKTNNVGVFIGSFYEEKRIDFMLNALLAIKKAVPDFEMLIVGDGEQRELVTQFCAEYPWARYMGLCKGKAKVDLLAVSSVMINPGLVGLGILDSFVCAVPMLTTDCGLHSPEIAYLSNGNNGVITENSLEEYVAVVIKLLNDDIALKAMQQACLVSAKEYSVENMARNFAEGIMQCLSQPIYRGSK
ncbi:glycosyltransferase family 4 protein [Iodobacter sp. CM08]|uniref:glycosyltransferase family 4 protein n=1 Tax=Iodobacter sp. CM08 TaxID=3085902 RepID=UPI00298232A3|nr:glycosyltransferase family 4 protein [Iodobacter sp. CM08]MDW5416686.1 glycosyltransferase family 4 protein [Iodobacter sp. CM08]